MKATRAKILVTFLSRFGSAAISFLVAILLSQYLGAEGKGEAAKLILNISFINLLTNVMGGSAMVFLVPRFHAFSLATISYLWIFASIAILYFISLAAGIQDSTFNLHTFNLALLLALFQSNTNLLLGKQKTTTFNILSLLQALLTLLYLVAVFYLPEGEKSYTQYIYALYIGYGLSFIASLVYTLKEIPDYGFRDVNTIVQKFIKHGGYLQLANLSQLLIYRSSYYIINYYQDIKQLGIYSNAIAIAESIWIVSRSISTVQYAEVSNETNLAKSVQKTQKLRNTNVLIAVALVLVVCVFPDSFYTLLFGRDFTGMQELIWWLAPGIIAFAYSTITTHFFAGIGKNHYNTIISFSGFVITLAVGIVLIPTIGLQGAALTASITYMLNAYFAQLLFKRTVSGM